MISIEQQQTCLHPETSVEWFIGPNLCNIAYALKLQNQPSLKLWTTSTTFVRPKMRNTHSPLGSTTQSTAVATSMKTTTTSTFTWKVYYEHLQLYFKDYVTQLHVQIFWWNAFHREEQDLYRSSLHGDVSRQQTLTRPTRSIPVRTAFHPTTCPVYRLTRTSPPPVQHVNLTAWLPSCNRWRTYQLRLINHQLQRPDN